jgi:hypothetical protein
VPWNLSKFVYTVFEDDRGIRHAFPWHDSPHSREVVRSLRFTPGDLMPARCRGWPDTGWVDVPTVSFGASRDVDVTCVACLATLGPLTRDEEMP